MLLPKLPYIKDFLHNLPSSNLSEYNFLASAQLRAKSRKYLRIPNTLAMKNLIFLSEKCYVYN